MRIGPIVAVATLVTVLAVTAGQATPEDDRCKASILSRGTGLFAAELDVLRRCKNAELSSTLDAGCPSPQDSLRIDGDASRATAAIDRACTVPNPQFAACVLAAADESSDVAFGVFAASPLPEPDRTRRSCRAAVGREAVRFAKLKAKKLASCNAGVIGGAGGTGPSGPACDGPAGTQGSIDEAGTRLAEKIGRACGGADHQAGTADDPDPQDGLGFGATCPGQPYCAFPIDTVPDLVACTRCIAASEVDQISRGFAALPLDASTACVLALDRAAVTLARDALRDLSDCEEFVLRGTRLPPCPDAETLTDLGSSANRFQQTVEAACGAPATVPAGVVQSLAMQLVGFTYPLHAEEPDVDLRNCKLAIGEFTEPASSYAGVKFRALGTCRLLNLCGQTSAACPDPEASERIARAASAVATRIHARCDAYSPDALGFGTTCPGFGPCATLPTTTIDELITCLTCSADLAADILPALLFP